MHRKVYLPTYGLFDEQRYLAAGDRFRAFDASLGGRSEHRWRAGILICEDLWHPSAAALLARQGTDLIICPSASPGSGLIQGETVGTASSYDVMTRTYAQLFTTYVMYCNRSGFEDGVGFWGGSRVVDPDRQRGRGAARCAGIGALSHAGTQRGPPRARRLSAAARRTKRCQRRRDRSTPTPARSRLTPPSSSSGSAASSPTGCARWGSSASSSPFPVVSTPRGRPRLRCRHWALANVSRDLHAVSDERSPVRRSMRVPCVSGLGVVLEMVDITPQVDDYFARFPDADRTRRGNKMARERMSILYDYLDGRNGARARHLQQDRAAARIRDAFRRHGERAQPDRRPVQDPAVCACARASPAAQRAHQTAERRPVGRPVG